jgi:ABC-type nitrate/sulfonate/bicarbonate transport system substrate-binding protein
MTLKIRAVVFAAFLFAVAGGMYWFMALRESSPAPKESPLAQVVIALPQHPPAALLFVAAAEKLFEKHGVQPVFKRFVSGARALPAMLAGEADLAGVADVPVAATGLVRSDFKVLAGVARADNDACIVARRDRGISKPSDMSGKKIGTQKLSAVHYFQDGFLAKHKVENVQKSFFKVEELLFALKNGTIDASTLREPYIGQAKRELGDKVVVFCDDNFYLRGEFLVVRNEFLKNHRNTAERVLRALIEAETFVHGNAAVSIAHTANELKSDVNAIEAIWPSMEFEVSLTQSALAQLEAEGGWAQQYADNKADGILPNYLSLIDATLLGGIDSKRVTMVH